MSANKIIFHSLIYFFLFTLFLPFSLTAQNLDENRSKFNLTGTMRFRGSSLGRDVPLTRNTSAFPVSDIPGYYQTQAKTNNDLIISELEAKYKNQPSVITKRKERLDYIDSRILVNMEVKTSENFDAVFGFVVWDVLFGGRAVQPTGPNADQSANLIGAGTGGELLQGSGVNLQASSLFINYKLKQYDFSTRFGIQFFSSVQGRVFYSTGAGVSMSKEYKKQKISLEGGWIRGRERSLADVDYNGFSDRNYQNTNIFFGKFKYFKIRNYKGEAYSYFLNDTDPTDSNNETGKLFWHGWFNELNFGKFNFILHGVYNHGKISINNILYDNSETELYRTVNRYNIKGYLYDAQISYQYSGKLNFNLIAIGTSGRPGIDRDGMSSNNKGSGYRTLAPGYAISNIAIDFVGGYALFNARNMSGLSEFGGFVNAIVFGPLQVTLGYYRLYANKAPRLSTNRDYNSLFGNRSSNYMGQEMNLNLKWSFYSDFQIIFRSGYFIPGDGLRALNDYQYGNYLREAFVMGEYKF